MAIDAFLKLDGIKGESKDSKHGGEIDVLSYSWGVSQIGSAQRGGGAGSGKVNVNDLHIQKFCDAATPTLLLKICDGTHIKSAILTLRKAGGANPIEYLKYELGDLIVSSFQSSGASSGDMPMESISLNFATFKCHYTAQKKDGSAEPAVTVGWSILENKKL
jgi:type VI secretion system secreted protein Hcp